MQSLPYKVLNFFYDEENSCALTILVKKSRFHIIADVNDLRNGTDSSADHSDIWKTYSQLLANHRRSSEGEDCGSRDDSIDSGVDMGTSLTTGGGSKLADDADTERALCEWLTSPLLSQINEIADKPQDRKPTLSEWYTFPTRFYSLKIHNGKLQAEELESTQDLEKRMSKLFPDLSPIPKYIRDIDVPWISSDDLGVLNCRNSPPPYHPTLVELSVSASDDEKKQTLFFKCVDNANIQPTKREISLLHQLEKKGLHDKIRCPRLKGIVTQSGDDTSIVGFLQTLIPNPIPLTEKFESSIDQEKRETWAKEAEQMKDTLHEHGIIWGDAKGDNFVVDSSDELWIIDFGGSYTEGWVDPDIAETKEGDNMGVEKVVNALRDPDNNVACGSEDKNEDDDGPKGEKRKVSEDEQPQGNKRRKATEEETPVEDDDKSEPRYCYCGGVSSGQMIGCDGLDCKMEWFHIECTDLTKLPGEEESWVCRNCEAS